MSADGPRRDGPRREELPGAEPASSGWQRPAGGEMPQVPSWPGAGPATAPPRPAPHGLRLAGYGARVQAAVIDFFVRLAIVVVLLLVFGTAAAAVGNSSVGFVIGGILAFVLALAYAPWMIATHDGQTLGHKASRSRIVNRDGSRLTGGPAAVREILVKGLLIDTAGGFLVIPTVVNYLWPLWDEHDEALHDKLCGTRVVQA